MHHLSADRWLARRRSATAGISRAALVVFVFVFGVAVINASDFYAQLVVAQANGGGTTR
jgi:hypothetical protein